MLSVNERLLHEAILHALQLQRYGNGAVRKLIGVLNASSAELGAALASALQRLPLESFTVSRLDQVLESIKGFNTRAYAALTEGLVKELQGLAAYELGYQAQLFTAAIPQQIIVALPLAHVDPQQVYAAAMARPFQGRLLKEWTASQEVQAMQRIRDTVRSGYVAQESISTIVSRVRGTRANNYDDGAMAIDRRNAEAVVRTAIGHTAGYARDVFMKENNDLVKQQQWVSTLDSRTSEPCILRDGLLYDNTPQHKPVGHAIPWGAGPGQFHWNCRSVSVPVVKSFRELGIDIPELPAGTRASVDGQVAADTTYGDWLLKQSAARQDEVLGPTRGKMLREGKLDVSAFANDKGRWLTLDELRAKDSNLFA